MRLKQCGQVERGERNYPRLHGDNRVTRCLVSSSVRYRATTTAATDRAHLFAPLSSTPRFPTPCADRTTTEGMVGGRPAENERLLTVTLTHGAPVHAHTPVLVLSTRFLCLRGHLFPFQMPGTNKPKRPRQSGVCGVGGQWMTASGRLCWCRW